MLLEISVPSLLKDCTDNKRTFEIEAETLKDALTHLKETYPLLRHHLYTEGGQIRQHVLIFYNDQNITWMNRLDVPIRPGDRLLIMQAVSGG